MVNEVLQWVVLAATLLLVLGVYRQLALVTPPPNRVEIGGPAVGRRLPDALWRSVRPLRGDGDRDALIAFVSEGCQGCSRLLAAIDEQRPELEHDLTIVARQPSQGYADMLSQLGHPVIEDRDGTIWRQAHVTATPLLVLVDPDGTVTRKELANDLAVLTSV